MLVKKYNEGEFFGELALLYNAPRAASIFAKSENCILWALDRETFNNIVREAAIKKRQKYEKFLRSVDILKTMEDYEISQICDAVQSETVNANDIIIKQVLLVNFFRMRLGISFISLSKEMLPS